MKKFKEILLDIPTLTNHYLISLINSNKNRELFDNIEQYFMFIGYPRSGHSLIGSLLDAHPNIVVAQELGVLKYILARFNKAQIYYLLLENSRKFTERGRQWGDYSYKVHNQWQGTFKKLKIIGDKQGGGACLRLKARPWLLLRLRDTIGSIKSLHVIRNPYDNISTISKQHNMNLKDSIDYYFSFCETIAKVKEQLNNDELFEFRQESFIDDPKKLLKEICEFLREDAPNEYLNSCASVVYKSPHKSRYKAQWSDELIEIVNQRISQYFFLNGYSFHD